MLSLKNIDEIDHVLSELLRLSRLLSRPTTPSLWRFLVLAIRLLVYPRRWINPDASWFILFQEVIHVKPSPEGYIMLEPLSKFFDIENQITIESPLYDLDWPKSSKTTVGGST